MKYRDYREKRWECSLWVVAMSVFWHYRMDWVYWQDVESRFVMN